MRTKLALVPQMGLDVIVEEVELADPTEYDVRIKVMTCTICNSDILALKGIHNEYKGPGAAGHEIAGIVDGIGAKVTYVKPGDRVLCTEVRAGCGVCPQCLAGNQWFCENQPEDAHAFVLPSQFTRDNGEVVINTCQYTSGFAEYCIAHESMLCKIDDDIPFRIGSALACGFMSGFGAVLNRSKVSPAQSFAVVGCGGVGLSAIMGARYCGAVPIIGVDTQENKLEAAKRFGATHVFNPKECDVVREVKKVTRGYGVDQSFVAAAGPGIKKTCFDLTADYGQITIVGHGNRRDEFMAEINWMDFLFGKRVTGCVMGGITLRRDIPAYMDMYRKGLIDIDALLTNHFSLDQIKEALEDSLTGSLKNVVHIGEPAPARA
ncbi:MAG: zinc-binding dehydrogenase [Clostridiales Family XIII bacterium]|jgi:Zn-dependent alcohol dehydrogenase|nr:zinc-binding dehydrogenase [Clostridiales Family XIII bacterium]